MQRAAAVLLGVTGAAAVLLGATGLEPAGAWVVQAAVASRRGAAMRIEVCITTPGKVPP